MTFARPALFARAALACSAAIGLSALPAQAQSWGAHGGMSAPAAIGAHGATMAVDVNRTYVLRLPHPASAVVVGNPAVADIAVHTTDTILVLGRNFGSTNIIAFDSNGNVMSETTVNVGETPMASRVRVYEGADVRKTYNCAGDCLPTPVVGDDPAYRTLNMNSVSTPVTDTVVSRAGTDFGSVPGQPFTANPAPASSPAPMSQPTPFVPPAGASPFSPGASDGIPAGFTPPQSAN